VNGPPRRLRSLVLTGGVAAFALLLLVWAAPRSPRSLRDSVLDRPEVRDALGLLGAQRLLPPAGPAIGDGGPAARAVFEDPTHLWVDERGRLFVSDRRHHRIRKIENGRISTVAGNGRPGYTGDGRGATGSRISFPQGLIGDGEGGLVFADTHNHRIRRLAPDGTLRTLMGTGARGSSGDGGPGLEATLAEPSDVCLAPGGVLFVADTKNHRVRRLRADGVVETAAGTGEPGFSGDGGPAVQARLHEPWGIACGPDGRVYVADSENHRVRVIEPSGVIRTLAGTGEEGFSGDGGLATAAALSSPQSIAVAPDGSLLIGDEHNHRVRRLRPDGTIETAAGTGEPGFSGDGGPAVQARLRDPESVLPLDDGGFLIADGDNDRIRKVDAAGVITTLYGGDSSTR